MKTEKEVQFNRILEKNKEKIYRICKVYTVPPVEPQDLFQEVLFQIWKSLDGFKNKSSIDTWVYRITLNVCMRSKMKLDKKQDKLESFQAIHIVHENQETSDIDNERFRLLKECIATLNETDTSIIVLYLDELSYKEIAEITGLSENHVAVKMKRIKKKLFNCMTKKMK